MKIIFIIIKFFLATDYYFTFKLFFLLLKKNDSILLSNYLNYLSFLSDFFALKIDRLNNEKFHLHM